MSGKFVVTTTILIIIAGILSGICMPKTTNTVKNKLAQLDDKISQNSVVDNYKSEYNKMLNKKKEIESIINEFKAALKYQEQKYVEETALLANYKVMLENAQKSNDSEKFNVILNQYKSQKIKVESIAKVRDGYKDGLKNTEAALEKLDLAIINTKSNIDVVQYKKTLVDTYKNINGMLDKVKNGGDFDTEINIEKLDEDFIREGVKLETITITDKSFKGPIKSQEEMKDILKHLDD